jgi:hypothetical protein
MMFSDRSNAHCHVFLDRPITARALHLGLPILIVALWLMPLHARKHQRWGEELSVDMEVPFDRLTKIVQEVSQDAVIRGTWQYRGTTELDAATPSTTAPGFVPWKGQGVVLYKVRLGALAPQHFYESGDQGTVAVRYIVEPAGANVAHLRIQAVFTPEDGHRLHPSDGAVENAEFAEISRKLEDQKDQERKQGEGAVQEQQVAKTDELRAELERDRAELNLVTAKREQLETELRDLEKGGPGRIRTASADLKAAPYNQSKTIRLLSRDEAVTVIERTENWYRVEIGSGEQGWVYRLMVEVRE